MKIKLLMILFIALAGMQLTLYSSNTNQCSSNAECNDNNNNKTFCNHSIHSGHCWYFE